MGNEKGRLAGRPVESVCVGFSGSGGTPGELGKASADPESRGGHRGEVKHGSVKVVIDGNNLRGLRRRRLC